jgi:hypothetical protein
VIIVESFAQSGYIALILELTPAQIVLAFSRAAMEYKHFPVPALLRSFASIGEPVAVEAKEGLRLASLPRRGVVVSENSVFRSSHWKFLILGLHEVHRVTSTKYL